MSAHGSPPRPRGSGGPRPPRHRCGLCGSARVVPVLYGLPGPEMAERADRDEIVLGGCVLFPDREVLFCRDCGAGLHADSGWQPRRPEEP